MAINSVVYSLLMHSKELSQNQTLHKLLSLLREPDGLIKTFNRERQFHDEPKFWYYNATLNESFLPHDGINFSASASGFSFFTKETAILKCLAESVERFCNYHFEHSFVTQYSRIKDTNNIIPTEHFARYSNRQLSLKQYHRFVFKPSTKIHWTDCIHLTSNNIVNIPSNFVYLSSPYISTESLIYPPISTGVAGGSTLLTAIIRGLYEIVERDAYAIAFLHKLVSPKIPLQTVKNRKVQSLIELAKKYNMEVICLDLTTDIGIPVVGALVIDRTGIGKAISIGLKSDLNVVQAILGAITEAFHTKGWIRKLFEDNKYSQNEPQQRTYISDFARRGLWWYSISKIKFLNFWLQNANISHPHISNKQMLPKQEFHHLVDRLSSCGCDIYWKNLTLPVFQNLSYYVVKTIVPQLQPLVFDELRPLLGGSRLDNVPKALGLQSSKEINRIPNPFL